MFLFTRVMCLVVGQLLGLFAADLLVEDVQESTSQGRSSIQEVAETRYAVGHEIHEDAWIDIVRTMHANECAHADDDGEYQGNPKDDTAGNGLDLYVGLEEHVENHVEGHLHDGKEGAKPIECLDKADQ